MIKELWIVDDDQIFQFGFSLFLEKNNVFESLKQFEDASEAHYELQKRLNNGADFPDFILLDINMPVMNGWELLDVLSSSEYTKRLNQRISILSSSSAVIDKAKASSYPILNGYISKSVGTDETIKSLIDQFAKLSS